MRTVDTKTIDCAFELLVGKYDTKMLVTERTRFSTTFDGIDTLFTETVPTLTVQETGVSEELKANRAFQLNLLRRLFYKGNLKTILVNDRLERLQICHSHTVHFRIDLMKGVAFNRKAYSKHLHCESSTLAESSWAEPDRP